MNVPSLLSSSLLALVVMGFSVHASALAPVSQPGGCSNASLTPGDMACAAGGIDRTITVSARTDATDGQPTASDFSTAPFPSDSGAAPEPETYVLILAGLGVLGFVAQRRRPPT